jgi:hypothetical protein
MPIPCPDHHPAAWIRYTERHGPRVDWRREADIARSCCPDCADEDAATDSPSEESKPWTEHERCSDCGEGHMSGCSKHEAAPRCRWSSRIGYDCELTEDHEGQHTAIDLDGKSRVGWTSSHRSAYQRQCPSPADELTDEAEKLGMYLTNEPRPIDDEGNG